MRRLKACCEQVISRQPPLSAMKRRPRKVAARKPQDAQAAQGDHADDEDGPALNRVEGRPRFARDDSDLAGSEGGGSRYPAFERPQSTSQMSVIISSCMTGIVLVLLLSQHVVTTVGCSGSELWFLSSQSYCHVADLVTVMGQSRYLQFHDLSSTMLFERRKIALAVEQ
jgi:hypothetical protein